MVFCLESSSCISFNPSYPIQRDDQFYPRLRSLLLQFDIIGFMKLPLEHECVLSLRESSLAFIEAYTDQDLARLREKLDRLEAATLNEDIATVLEFYLDEKEDPAIYLFECLFYACIEDRQFCHAWQSELPKIEDRDLRRVFELYFVSISYQKELAFQPILSELFFYLFSEIGLKLDAEKPLEETFQDFFLWLETYQAPHMKYVEVFCEKRALKDVASYVILKRYYFSYQGGGANLLYACVDVLNSSHKQLVHLPHSITYLEIPYEVMKVWQQSTSMLYIYKRNALPEVVVDPFIPLCNATMAKKSSSLQSLTHFSLKPDYSTEIIKNLRKLDSESYDTFKKNIYNVLGSDWIASSDLYIGKDEDPIPVEGLDSLDVLVFIENFVAFFIEKGFPLSLGKKERLKEFLDDIQDAKKKIIELRDANEVHEYLEFKTRWRNSLLELPIGKKKIISLGWSPNSCLDLPSHCIYCVVERFKEDNYTLSFYNRGDGTSLFIQNSSIRDRCASKMSVGLFSQEEIASPILWDYLFDLRYLENLSEGRADFSQASFTLFHDYSLFFAYFNKKVEFSNYMSSQASGNCAIKSFLALIADYFSEGYFEFATTLKLYALLHLCGMIQFELSQKEEHFESIHSLIKLTQYSLDKFFKRIVKANGREIASDFIFIWKQLYQDIKDDLRDIPQREIQERDFSCIPQKMFSILEKKWTLPSCQRSKEPLEFLKTHREFVDKSLMSLTHLQLPYRKKNQSLQEWLMSHHSITTVLESINKLKTDHYEMKLHLIVRILDSLPLRNFYQEVDLLPFSQRHSLSRILEDITHRLFNLVQMTNFYTKEEIHLEKLLLLVSKSYYMQLVLSERDYLDERRTPPLTKTIGFDWSFLRQAYIYLSKYHPTNHYLTDFKELVDAFRSLQPLGEFNFYEKLKLCSSVSSHDVIALASQIQAFDLEGCGEFEYLYESFRQGRSSSAFYLHLNTLVNKKKSRKDCIETELLRFSKTPFPLPPVNIIEQHDLQLDVFHKAYLLGSFAWKQWVKSFFRKRDFPFPTPCLRVEQYGSFFSYALSKWEEEEGAKIHTNINGVESLKIYASLGRHALYCDYVKHQKKQTLNIFLENLSHSFYSPLSLDSLSHFIDLLLESEILHESFLKTPFYIQKIDSLIGDKLDSLDINCFRSLDREGSVKEILFYSFLGFIFVSFCRSHEEISFCSHVLNSFQVMGRKFIDLNNDTLFYQEYDYLFVMLLLEAIDETTFPKDLELLLWARFTSLFSYYHLDKDIFSSSDCFLRWMLTQTKQTNLWKDIPFSYANRVIQEFYRNKNGRLHSLLKDFSTRDVHLYLNAFLDRDSQLDPNLTLERFSPSDKKRFYDNYILKKTKRKLKEEDVDLADKPQLILPENGRIIVFEEDCVIMFLSDAISLIIDTKLCLVKRSLLPEISLVQSFQLQFPGFSSLFCLNDLERASQENYTCFLRLKQDIEGIRFGIDLNLSKEIRDIFCEVASLNNKRLYFFRFVTSMTFEENVVMAFREKKSQKSYLLKIKTSAEHVCHLSSFLICNNEISHIIYPDLILKNNHQPPLNVLIPFQGRHRFDCFVWVAKSCSHEIKIIDLPLKRFEDRRRISLIKNDQGQYALNLDRRYILVDNTHTHVGLYSLYYLLFKCEKEKKELLMIYPEMESRVTSSHLLNKEDYSKTIALNAFYETSFEGNVCDLDAIEDKVFIYYRSETGEFKSQDFNQQLYLVYFHCHNENFNLALEAVQNLLIHEKSFRNNPLGKRILQLILGYSPKVPSFCKVFEALKKKLSSCIRDKKIPSSLDKYEYKTSQLYFLGENKETSLSSFRIASLFSSLKPLTSTSLKSDQEIRVISSKKEIFNIISIIEQSLASGYVQITPHIELYSSGIVLKNAQNLETKTTLMKFLFGIFLVKMFWEEDRQFVEKNWLWDSFIAGLRIIHVLEERLSYLDDVDLLVKGIKVISLYKKNYSEHFSDLKVIFNRLLDFSVCDRQFLDLLETSLLESLGKLAVSTGLNGVETEKMYTSFMREILKREYQLEKIRSRIGYIDPILYRQRKRIVLFLDNIQLSILKSDKSSFYALEPDLKKSIIKTLSIVNSHSFCKKKTVIEFSLEELISLMISEIRQGIALGDFHKVLLRFHSEEETLKQELERSFLLRNMDIQDSFIEKNIYFLKKITSYLTISDLNLMFLKNPSCFNQEQLELFRRYHIFLWYQLIIQNKHNLTPEFLATSPHLQDFSLIVCQNLLKKVLSQEQEDVIRNLVKEKNGIAFMMMGSGKTSVVLPITLHFLLRFQTRAIWVMLPETLFDTQFPILIQQVSLLGIGLKEISFSRQMCDSVNLAKLLHTLYQNHHNKDVFICKESTLTVLIALHLERKVVIERKMIEVSHFLKETLKESSDLRKAFKDNPSLCTFTKYIGSERFDVWLKELEKLYVDHGVLSIVQKISILTKHHEILVQMKQESSYLNKILSFLKESYLCLDEIDSYSVSNVHRFPLASYHTPSRSLFEVVTDLYFHYLPQTIYYDSFLKGESHLNEDLKSQLIPNLASLIVNDLKIASDEIPFELWVDYLIQPIETLSLADLSKKVDMLSEEKTKDASVFKKIKIYKEILSYQLVSAYSVPIFAAYAPSQKTSQLQVIPQLANGIAKEGSQFHNPIYIALLSCQFYLHQIKNSRMLTAFSEFILGGFYSLERKEEISFNWGVSSLDQIVLDDSLLGQLLEDKIRTREPLTLNVLKEFFISSFFEKEIRTPCESVTVNIYDVTRSFYGCKGFCGTLAERYNLEYPLIDVCSTQDRVIQSFLKSSHIVEISSTTSEEFVAALPQACSLIGKTVGDVHHIIDVASVFKGMNNQSVVNLLKKHFSSYKQHYVTYNTSKEKECYAHYSLENFDSIKISGDLNEYLNQEAQSSHGWLFYHDQGHIRGANVIFPVKSLGVISCHQTISLHDFLQGVYRLRRLFQGEDEALVLISPEFGSLIRDAFFLSSSESITSQHLIDFLLLKTNEKEVGAHVKGAMMRFKNTIKKILLEELSDKAVTNSVIRHQFFIESANWESTADLGRFIVIQRNYDKIIGYTQNLVEQLSSVIDQWVEKSGSNSNGLIRIKKRLSREFELFNSSLKDAVFLEGISHEQQDNEGSVQVYSYEQIQEKRELEAHFEGLEDSHLLEPYLFQKNPFLEGGLFFENIIEDKQWETERLYALKHLFLKSTTESGFYSQFLNNIYLTHSLAFTLKDTHKADFFTKLEKPISDYFLLRTSKGWSAFLLSQEQSIHLLQYYKEAFDLKCLPPNILWVTSYVDIIDLNTNRSIPLERCLEEESLFFMVIEILVCQRNWRTLALENMRGHFRRWLERYPKEAKELLAHQLNNRHESFEDSSICLLKKIVAETF